MDVDLIFHPVVFHSPVGGEAQIPQYPNVCRIALVPGQHRRGQGVAVFRGNGLRSGHIRRELLRRLSFFLAIVMGKSVAADLLPRRFGNQLHQRRGKKAGRVRFRFSDFGELGIGIQRRVVVGRPQTFLREKRGRFLCASGEQEPNRRPRSVDAVFLEQRQQLGNRLSAAQNVILILLQRTHVQHSPKQLKIQRYDQRSSHAAAPLRSYT